MPVPPIAPAPNGTALARIAGRTRFVVLAALLVLMILCLAFAWATRDAMAHLPFIAGQGGVRAPASTRSGPVDQSPFQTAQALAPLAVTAEETAFAREAQHLADHEVDQAFASALRTAALEAQHRVLTGDALALSQKVAQLQQLIRQDQALVQRLTPAAASSPGATKAGPQPATGSDDLEVAKAQLGLDSDELADAQNDLARASGDNSAEIQNELTEREAAMRKYDAESQSDGQIAILSAAQHGTLASRIKAWFSQESRYRLLQQALEQAQADAARLTAEHNALEARANAGASPAGSDAADSATRLANIKDRAGERQILSIYDDRIQTEQQLAAVYGKWSAQVLLQHRIVLHLMLQSMALIFFILLCMVVGDVLVRRLMSRLGLDRRQGHTLRTILEVGLQIAGAVSILLVAFGMPQQTTTMLGLVTAGLTIALQDVILSFFGWFVLVGKNGIHVGDWVEIDGVGGEVTDIGLMRTTLLETGGMADKGYPTGRRISFLNSFAIHGQYFNFSTSGQWMWDEIVVSIPASDRSFGVVERIQEAVMSATVENARIAEEDWKRGAHGETRNLFSATPSVNLRPSADLVEVRIRYVTRASERFEMRNRLYQLAIELLHAQQPAAAQTV
ncbi:MAG: mechanosensitive ion channel domain-containing protein [Terracidiphilus sp.]